MATREKIKLRRGCMKKLIADCHCAPNTAMLALAYMTDTDLAERIRKTAYEKGYVSEI